eukprot:gnl/MRDRNA2_/MRDRNA2_179636_c0_seq1.p1 gnl/MRDRNA2_/MRDRNA2_179636_c0~~gnl/MRDRNA2_/MRDRNA2_179636_c0_seq1.p1  ORF type:complete len:225 (-),score=47.78 gnl/MRDRNA2_/MRDRNA2_179636_c0_seq1:122-721(-)
MQDPSDAHLVLLTEKLMEVMQKENDRQMALNAVIELRDKLHTARQLGKYCTEAGMIEKIAGRMQMSESYNLHTMVGMIQDPAESSELANALQQIQRQSQPYEFFNTSEATEMTVTIKVPQSTRKDDVKVKITKTAIRIEVQGHECQPCVIDGHFFRPVEPGAFDFHLEGAGETRILVLDLEKEQEGYKWPELLGFGNLT